MCGIYGMMGPGILGKDFKIFRDLGTFSQTRGTDGAGIYQVRSIEYNSAQNLDNYEQLYKSDEPFSSLMNEIDYYKDKADGGVKNLLHSTIVDVVIGHNRSATVGSITQDNAHPFSFKNIIGAHNGTLRDAKYQHEHKTDSELMFQDINERGLSAVLSELDPRSAYAISMYDRNTRHMYFVRNNDRPLGMAFNTERGVLYWASELDMLKYTLERHNEQYKCFTVIPNKVLKIYAGDISLDAVTNSPAEILTVTDVPKPVVMEERNNVVPFAPSTKSFHAQCACGSNHLNLVDIRYAQKGQHRDYRYVKINNTEKYYCTDCDPRIEVLH